VQDKVSIVERRNARRAEAISVGEGAQLISVRHDFVRITMVYRVYRDRVAAKLATLISA
jgi:hypothetical protein